VLQPDSRSGSCAAHNTFLTNRPNPLVPEHGEVKPLRCVHLLHVPHEVLCQLGSCRLVSSWIAVNSDQAGRLSHDADVGEWRQSYPYWAYRRHGHPEIWAGRHPKGHVSPSNRCQPCVTSGWRSSQRICRGHMDIAHDIIAPLLIEIARLLTTAVWWPWPHASTQRRSREISLSIRYRSKHR